MPLATPVNRWHDEYWNMVAKWREIVAQPLSSEAKWDRCLLILRGHIDRIALSHARHRNPALRFYADMLLLRQQLFPAFATEELGVLIIWPAYRLVDEVGQIERPV